MEFREWLLNEGGSRSGTKSGLYALGSGGFVGLYPPSYYTPYAADAAYYMSIDARLKYLGIEGPPHDIRHIPGKPKFLTTRTGDGEPFKITNLPK